ncbi:MAG: WD40 repeat domain-containing protein [Candidatus Protochlamydia sp.]|nr:WD40 repeat domain-containing protein [Candidatus Protochlamydia sp.]
MCNLNLSTFPFDIKHQLFNFVDEQTLINSVRLINRSFNQLVNQRLGRLFHTTFKARLIAIPPKKYNNEFLTEAQYYLYNKKIMGMIKKLWFEALAKENDGLIKKLKINHAKCDLPLTLFPVDNCQVLAVNQFGFKPLSFSPHLFLKYKPITIVHSIQKKINVADESKDRLIFDLDPYFLDFQKDNAILKIMNKIDLAYLPQSIKLEQSDSVIKTDKYIYIVSKDNFIKKFSFNNEVFSEIMSFDLKIDDPIEWFDSVGKNKHILLARSQQKLMGVEESSQKILFQHFVVGKCLAASKYLFYVDREEETLRAAQIEDLLNGKPLKGIEVIKDVLQFIKGEECLFVQNIFEDFQILNFDLEVLRSGKTNETITTFTSKNGLGAFGTKNGSIHIYSLKKGSTFCKTLKFSHLGEITGLYWAEALTLLVTTSNGSLVYCSPVPLSILS